MRTINAEGLAYLKQWEGLELTAYQDTGGVWTVGYGSTGPHVKPGMTITEAEAERLLRDDLADAEAAVDRLVKVPLTANQFAALVSLTYNIGRGAFTKSTLLRKLNAGDYAAVPGQLARWNKVDGKVVNGLVNRRAAETGLWARGAFVTSAGPTTATPEAPPIFTKENVATAATAVSALGAVASGTGPMQYAFAAILVLAALVGGFLFLRKRMRPA